MSLSSSKLKYVSGVALIASALTGCGGGGGGGATNNPPAASGLTEGSTNCLALTGGVSLAASTGAVIGSCEQYENSPAPTKAATAFRNPSSVSLVAYSPLSTTSLYQVPLSFDQGPGGSFTSFAATDKVSIAGGLATAALGQWAGETFEKVLDQSKGAAARVYDFTSSTDIQGQLKVDLTTGSRFGVVSRFDARTIGFYGGWAIPANTVFTNPLSGTRRYKGRLTGVVGPSASNTLQDVPYGFSATMELDVNFGAAAPITRIAFSQITYSLNGQQSGTVVKFGTAANASSSAFTASSNSINASFSVPTAVGNTGINDGRIVDAAIRGLAVAANGAVPAKLDGHEMVGTMKFVTSSGQNAVGAFGLQALP